ncbi:unnamed protein product [Ectocarpus fasciculatus]
MGTPRSCASCPRTPAETTTSSWRRPRPQTCTSTMSSSAHFSGYPGYSPIRISFWRLEPGCWARSKDVCYARYMCVWLLMGVVQARSPQCMEIGMAREPRVLITCSITSMVH